MTGQVAAKNYASQVSALLPEWIKAARADGRPGDALALESVASLWPQAHHFTLPDGGKVFDDGLRGLRDTRARLPYPVITVESVFSPTDDNTTPFGAVSEAWNVKQLSVAFEQDCAAFKAIMSLIGADHHHVESLTSDDDTFIVIVSFCTLNDQPHRWMPSPGAAYVRAGNWRLSTGKTTRLVEAPNDNAGFIVMPILPDTFGRVASHMGSAERAYKDMAGDTMVDCRHVLELCEALSCANVTTEPAYNVGATGKKRKRGKAPLFETHRLVLKRPGQQSVSTGPGTHRSPRAHLRRGHIRRLSSGNIWVNACAVGSVKNGFVHKDYSVVGA